MSMQVRNTRQLVAPENFKLKILNYAIAGTGKTSWAATALDSGLSVGYIANETGEGKGLLSVAGLSIDYVVPTSVKDMEDIFAGKIFAEKDVLVWDSLSWATKTYIKDLALSLPRKLGNSPKRQIGIPELDDYGSMGEITRRLLIHLIDLPKHIVVNAGERYKGPDPETGVGESYIGPDLPGEMFHGSTAMFDFVLRLRTRARLANPQDAKSRFTQRYFMSANDGAGTIAKCRANSLTKKPFLAQEEIIDLKTGQGCFKYVLDKVVNGYAEEYAAKVGAITPGLASL